MPRKQQIQIELTPFGHTHTHTHTRACTHIHTCAPNAFQWEMENDSVSAWLTGVTQISARDDKNPIDWCFHVGQHCSNCMKTATTLLQPSKRHFLNNDTQLQNNKTFKNLNIRYKLLCNKTGNYV